MTAAEKNILLHGHAAPLPASTSLRAGLLSLIYCDGELRDLKIGDTVVIQRIYAAVRDENWETVPGRISEERIEAQENRFSVSFRCTHRRDGIHFTWQGSITGSAGGIVHFDFDGEAHTAFRKNRIGFCVLHSPTCSEWPTVADYSDGNRADVVFPRAISPEQPVRGLCELRAITHEIGDRWRVRIEFAGDVFETEDQRNWLDASFKTFCTPLRLPRPVDVAPGDRVRQSVVVRVAGTVPPEWSRGAPAADFEDAARAPHPHKASGGISGLEIVANPGAVRPLPRLGVGAASHGLPLSTTEVKLLSALRCAHVRVDVFLAHAGWEHALRRAATDAAALGTALELAVHLGDGGVAPLKQLAEEFAAAGSRVARILVYRAGRDCTDGPSLGLARAALASLSAPIGVGTDADFFQFNAGQPPADLADFLCWAAHPQAHAFDLWSVAENSTTFPAQLQTARARYPGRPAVISPITFRPRFNPYANGTVAAPDPGELPPDVDPRQLSLFGATWTLSAISQLAQGFVASATLFETTGWRGVMETAVGSALPGKFPSRPAQVFPLYHVLADIGEFADGQLGSCESSDPRTVATLLLVSGRKIRLLVANLTPAPREVNLAGLPSGRWTVRSLDLNSVRAATAEPAAWRDQPGIALPAATPPATLLLEPFAFVNLTFHAPN